MIEELKSLHKNSYSPYSNYEVSAIVVMKDGKKFVGVNVENAAYGSSICAERSAILSAISSGYKKHDFLELHVMVNDSKIGTPCFACRQVISELFDSDKIIYFYNNLGEVEKYTVEDLCPHPFSEDNLK